MMPIPKHVFRKSTINGPLYAFSLFFVFLFLSFFLYQNMDSYQLGLTDPDGYTRLLRVWQLYTSGDYFDQNLKAFNPPEGVSIHWTKPLDICLLLSMKILSFFMPEKEALYYGSFFWNPFFFFLAIAFLLGGGQGFLGLNGGLALGFLFIFSPIYMAYSQPNRIDHHLLQAFCLCGAMGLYLRQKWQSFSHYEIAMALILTLGMWVSCEYMFFTVLFLFTLYLTEEDKVFTKRLGYLACFTLAATLIERGPDWLNFQDIQRLSLLHALPFLYAYFIFSTIKTESLRIGIFSSVFLVHLWLCHPNFQIMDPLVKTLFFDHVQETRPLFGKNGFDVTFLPTLIPGYLALFFALQQKLWREHLPLFMPLVIYLFLVHFQIRQAIYLIPFVQLILALYIQKILDHPPHIKTAFAKSFSILMLPILTSLPSQYIKESSLDDEEAPKRRQKLVNQIKGKMAPNDVIMGWPELDTLALCWAYGARTVFAPYHQNTKGILDTFTFFGTNDKTIQKRILEQHEVDWVIAYLPALKSLPFPVPLIANKPLKFIYFIEQIKRE